MKELIHVFENDCAVEQLELEVTDGKVIYKGQRYPVYKDEYQCGTGGPTPPITCIDITKREDFSDPPNYGI